jgi:RND family efflux transporter MFP subunit
MANKSSTALKIGVVVVLLAAASYAAVSLLRPVARTTIAVAGPALNAVPGSVVVTAEKTVPIRCEIGGRIIQSELDPGKVVKAGDLLVQLDTGDVDLEIEKIQSDLAVTKAQLEVGSAIELELATAKDGLAFFERQAERGNYSASELEKRRREVKIIEQRRALEKINDKSKLEGLQNQLATKTRQREKMTLHAPFDGVITEVLAHKGALIGSESIGTMITLTRIVEGKVSEENFSGIAVGKKASVTFLGGLGGRSPEWIYDATVDKILPTADPVTQRYVVYLTVDVQAQELIPGKTGEVTITVDQRQSKAIVPRRALVGNYIYVIKNGRVEVRRVVVGYTWLTGAEITKGLETGEEVILENQDTFRDGQQVRVEREPIAAPAKTT